MKRKFAKISLVAVSTLLSFVAGVSYVHASPTPPTWQRNPSTAPYNNSALHRVTFNMCIKDETKISEVTFDWLYNDGIDPGYENTATLIIPVGNSKDFPRNCSVGGSSNITLNFDSDPNWQHQTAEALDGRYTVYIKASDGMVSSSTKNTTFTYDTMKPSVPVLSTTPSNGKVALSWTKSSGASAYKLYRNGFLIRTGGTGFRSFTDDLKNDASFSHQYLIKAVDAAGNSSTDTAFAGFTYSAPAATTANGSSTAQTPVVNASATQEKPNLNAGVSIPQNQEVEGSTDKPASSNLKTLKVASSAAMGLGILGAGLFWFLRRKEKSKAASVVRFETITVKPDVPEVKKDDNNPLTFSDPE